MSKDTIDTLSARLNWQWPWPWPKTKNVLKLRMTYFPEGHLVDNQDDYTSPIRQRWSEECIDTNHPNVFQDTFGKTNSVPDTCQHVADMFQKACPNHVVVHEVEITTIKHDHLTSWGELHINPFTGGPSYVEYPMERCTINITPR